MTLDSITQMIAQVSECPSKVCKKCLKLVPLSCFYPSYPSKCKSCKRKSMSDYNLTSRLCRINYRCNNPKSHNYKWYGGKGIKNFMTASDLKFLWERDKASGMKNPSIDRIDSNGHYRLDNCRFIEQSLNIKRTRPFSDDKVNKIRSLYGSKKFTQVELAKKFSVRQTTISNIVRKEHYSEV